MVKRKDICVVAHDATYGNAAEIAKALGCKLTLFSEDPKGMYEKYPYEKFIQPADECLCPVTVGVGETSCGSSHLWYDHKEKHNYY